MKRTIAERFQIMALTETVFAIDYVDYVLLTEGHYGCYISKKDMKLDISKLIVRKDLGTDMTPESLISQSVPAILTKHMLYTDRPLIKIRSTGGKKAWINHQWLKQFADGIDIRIINEKSPVYISDHRGFPLGIILPVNVSDDELE